MYPGCILGVSWVYPGCSCAYSWRILGVLMNKEWIFNKGIAFRLLTVPNDTYIAHNLFINGKAGTLHRKIFENNMDGQNSFMKIQDGLEEISKNSKKAFYSVGEQVTLLKEYQCKVC